MTRPILAALLSLGGTSLTDAEKRLFEWYNPLGVTLFNRNLENEEQAKLLIRNIKEVIGREDVVVAVDAEGGRVNRLQAVGYGSYASERVLGKIGSEEIAALHARLIANDMLKIGANMNFSPVLDLEYADTTASLQGRCFGDDEKKVSRLGKIMWKIYAENGICPCIKHMPGHGRAIVDPHMQLPIVHQNIKELERDFYPFLQNADCPAGMTAHILFPEIDADNPITLSAKGIREIIRKRIGFKGLLISDALDMYALRGSVVERAEAAWNAGCDVVCYCFGKAEEMKLLCENARFLDDVSTQRFEKVRKVFPLGKKSINLDNERKKYYSQVNQFADDEVNYDATEVLHQMLKGEK